MLLLFKFTCGFIGLAGSDLGAEIQPSYRGGNVVDGEALLLDIFYCGVFLQWNVFDWKFSRHVCLGVA